MKLSKPQKLIYDMEKFAGGAISVICGSMLIDGKRDISELKRAVNELYRLNDALRIRIKETDGDVHQEAIEYSERYVKVLYFENKDELDAYGEKCAKKPLDMYGNLCDINVVVLPEQYGIVAKLHHIIGDAWTLALIGSQFNAALNGDEIESYSYFDYIPSEDAYAQSKRYEKDRLYFLEQFKKCDEVTYINEKTTESLKAERKSFVIDSLKTKVITDYVRENESSAFMLFTAALAAYINRTKMNVEKFYIGTAVLNRSGAKEKNTMGMFVNTAPMLMELDNEKTFAENLASVKGTALSIFRHQKHNYSDVLSAIREGYKFGEKLYDVMISYQNASVTGGECESTWYHSGEQSESLQIHIDDRDSEGIFRIHYDYLIEKFTEHEIEKMHEHICNLLFSAIEDDSKKLYELNILSQEEKNTLLFDFNGTAVDYPRDKCVHQLFEEQAEKNPDKVAVVACDKTLTYKELNEEANRIAHSLLEKGIGRGDIVAFMLPRRSYLLSTMIGILKSGVAYMPIDPDYPQDRIEYMLSDSGAKLCVTDKNIFELLDNSNVNNPDAVVYSKDNCYCIYTSGSTGKPKGTLLTHGNVANYVNNNNNNVVHSIIKESYKNIVSVTTVGFDIFVTESLLPLANGMEIVLANEEQAKLQSKLNELIKSTPADVLQTTPTKMKSLIVDKEQLDYLKTIKVIILGGEALEETLVEELQSLTDAEIFNIYGPTEATVWGTNAEVKDLDITIGKPIANTQIYIVDKYTKPVPIGVTGELCIAGDCVGAGYLNRPELTAEKFIDNPFGEGKMYKTGDLAYWREDGNIAYVGRNDFQVKIRGLRIELGEIENAISSVDGINMSVVVVRKNSEGRQLICAFYTGEEKSAQEIKAVIGEKLPKYMLPHIFTYLDEIPLTSSGKISRKTLPEIDLENIETTVEFVAPETEEEQVLVECVKAVLGGEKVSTLDNFFDISGDSLKAIELTSQLESRGYEVQVKTIFDCETIQELAKELTKKESETAKVEYDNVIPATPAQMRVYTAQSMNADLTLYNIPYVFKVESLDVDKLQFAINKLIERHESLRTHFENQNGHIMQVIDDFAECKVKKISLSMTSGAELENTVKSFIRPFDLEKSLLLRVGYYENTVMIDIHHIISDGGTMPIFFKELNELYMGRDLGDNAVQYGEFAVQKVNLEESEKYWLSVFDDEIPFLELPTDIARTDKQSFNGSSVYDVIDIDLHNRITAKCKELNITPYVFYMSCFNILLSKFSGNEDIVVGMPVSGRSSHFLNTIGMFVNTIALRNKPEGNKNIIEFLNEVKVNSISAIDNQNYPFGELVKKLGIETSGRNPLFDVMFAYQSEQMIDVVFGDKRAELLPIPITSAKCDFTFNIMPRNDDVVVMVEYCTDLYKEKKIQKFVDAFKLILEQSLDEKSLIQDIEAMGKQEKQTLMFDFNDTSVDYPRDKCVHKLFEEQAENNPDKVAVVACDKTLTYNELNEEANRIAHSIIEKGIGRGDIVAFMLPRRSYLLSTMLGILKSGAAYMPIDPDYPQDRIEYMLEDSGAKLCITDKNIFELLDNSNVNNPDAVVYSKDNCYCIYTSGSTGKPKGTIIRHYNLINFCYNNNNNNNYQVTAFQEGTTVLSIFKSCFDAFGCDSILMLLNSKTIILSSEQEMFDADSLAEVIVEKSIDIIHATPSIIRTLCNSKKFLSALKYVRILMIAAENFSPELYKCLKENTSAKVFNGYGPSETTIGVSFGELNSTDIHIGKPIANTQIYIVDKYMKPVPIGVTGELCIAGDCVGAGYLNRPELTAEKFIDNPFSKGKMYKTGDLAYWREDGNIAYVGRNDFQVKIRGLRIELGEIENAISSVDGINMSVVVVRKNSEGRQLICAFYTGEEKSANEIKAVIGEKLPKYMLPHIFTHLDEMPLTSSGKTNRNALPKIDLENISNETEYIAPVTETEKLLCSIVSETLNIKRIGIEDDFFDLGGDSLKAIEFVSKAHVNGVYFTLQDVFDYPTVKSLCEFMTIKDKQHNTYNKADFAEIHKMLESNLDDDFVPEKSDMGDILVTGATGFLGIHIVSEYLESENGKVYCLVRGKDIEESISRFKKLLDYYFDGKYADLIGNRIVVFCGDVEKENLGLEMIPDVSMVINTAASVKHYGSYKYFYDINVGGAINSMNVANSANARFIQVSTLSVSGNSMVDIFGAIRSEESKTFSENDLYIEQQLDNVYIRSKFEAEYAILKEMLNGLKANIIRVGNLTNRASDFRFQPNYQSNAFLSRVKAVLEMGVFPEYLLDLYSEFSPIDDTAKAIIKIATHFNDIKTVFHVNSQKVVFLDKFIEYIKALGFDFNILNGESFANKLAELGDNENTRYIYEALINDMDENGNLVYDSNIHIENEHTLKYLEKLGFDWTEIGFEYIKGYIEYFRRIGYLK
ncbi:MAG: amino acid adenylation domain-containing protein [Ruminococcaceae bacterium]|nr:amino acid adenylation domain-containing protein [Oscillospiraceae bacterium]